MRHIWIGCALLTICGCLGLAEPGKVSRSSFDVGGRKHTYYLYIPKELPGEDLPLVVMLHGSGRDGSVLLKYWKELADREKLILVGPDALNKAGWTVPGDGPTPIYELVEMLREDYPIDGKRIYLFGHSAGGTYSLMMGLLEPGYFAAAAVSAGALPQGCNYAELDPNARKIPCFIVVGDRDPFFPVPVVQATRDYLVGRGYPVELEKIEGHDHNYYRRSKSINEQIWNFLKQHSLEYPPYYAEYSF